MSIRVGHRQLFRRNTFDDRAGNPNDYGGFFPMTALLNVLLGGRQ